MFKKIVISIIMIYLQTCAISYIFCDSYKICSDGSLELNYQGYSFKFFDSIGFENTLALPVIAQEILEDCYHFDTITFNNDDIMIDIGAHVGIISILHAKMYPYLKIYAFEPIVANYNSLLKNIQINNVKNIVPHNYAITADGRSLSMVMAYSDNSGTATFCLDRTTPLLSKKEYLYFVNSLSLDHVFKKYGINKCKLLKIDCEGAEHEILFNNKHLLSKIEYLTGEFHINNHLRKKGYSIDALKRLLLEYGIKIKITESYNSDDT